MAIGQGEGVELVLGGKIVSDGALANGHFHQPTIFGGAKATMRVAQEEIFGPVASIIPFDTEADAIRIANDSPYGLSGSLWTNDLGRSIRVTKAVRTGVMSVNSARTRRKSASSAICKR